MPEWRERMCMNTVSRGIRNAFRNGIRTFSIVVILGLSIGLALSMLVARQAVNDKITSVKSSIGNTVTVSPAGARGFEGGGTPLTSTQATTVGAIEHVTNVTTTLSDRLTSTTTNLVSSIEAGALGQRNASNSGVQFQAPPQMDSSSSSMSETRTFTPPVTVTGVNDLSKASVYGGSSVTYTSGAALDPTKNENVAVVGKNLADKNNLSVGSTFTMYSTIMTVAGIYDTGTTFSNNGLIVALSTLQSLSAQTGEITSMTVTVDSIDNVDTTVAAVKTSLGTAADVTSEQAAAATAVAPLENVKTIATYSLVGALVAGAVIVLLTMVMIVRERRREIGVVKAIGSSNASTMIQFMVESATLTIMGLAVGLGFAVLAATPITSALVDTSTSSSTTQQFGPGAVGVRGAARGLNESVKAVQASMKPEVILYGVGAALLIAIVGSAVPAYAISRVRPSEVMRAE